MNPSFEAHALMVRDGGIASPERIVALGRLLRAARVLCGLEQAEVGAAIRMTCDTISKLERGLTLPNSSTVGALVRFYEEKGVVFYPHEGAVALPQQLRALISGVPA